MDETKDVHEFVRNRIASIRIAHGYSCRRLSTELGKSTEYLNQVENGRLNPTIEFSSEFCDFFGITLSEFFDADNAQPVKFKELCCDLAVLDEEETKHITGIVKTLAESKRKRKKDE